MATLALHPFATLYGLAAGLMELTAGCSAGATDACLDCWHGMLTGQVRSEQLAAAVQVELLCRKAQRADLEWPIDPPARKAPHQYYQQAVAQADMRRHRAITHLVDLDNARSASASASRLSSHSEHSALGLLYQRVRLRELLLDPGLVTQEEQRALHRDIALLRATMQAAGTAAVPPQPPAFEYNARDRTLLQRFGLQREWLRYSLQAQLRRKYPVPESVARQLMAGVRLQGLLPILEACGSATAHAGKSVLARALQLHLLCSKLPGLPAGGCTERQQQGSRATGWQRWRWHRCCREQSRRRSRPGRQGVQ